MSPDQEWLLVETNSFGPIYGVPKAGEVVQLDFPTPVTVLSLAPFPDSPWHGLRVFGLGFGLVLLGIVRRPRLR